MVDFEKLVKEYKEKIIEESNGQINDPEKQAVIFTRDELIDFLRNEHGDEVEESYNLDDEEIRSFESADELWGWIDFSDLQEEVENYTFMDVYSVEIDGVRYWMGNMDELRYDEILDYALWYDEDYYENEWEPREV